MTRVEHIGPHTLYLGDCREILPTLGRVDAVVTDPPYGISYAQGDGGAQVAGRRVPVRRNNLAIVGDNEPFDPSMLLDFDELIAWGADHYAQRLPHGRWLAWDKISGASLVDSFSDVEFAWHSERGASRIISYLWKGVLQDGEKGVQRWHPTQKPIAVMEWCIKQLRKPAETILDPFMGSGTTGVACVKLGRKFIGIEIDERYFDIALKRVSEAMRQPDMFIEAAKSAPTQLDLMEI